AVVGDVLARQKVRDVDVPAVKEQIGAGADGVPLQPVRLSLAHDLPRTDVANRCESENFVVLSVIDPPGIDPAAERAGFGTGAEASLIVVGAAIVGLAVRMRKHPGDAPVQIAAAIRRFIIPGAAPQSAV